LQVDRARRKREHEQQHENRVQRQRALAPDARLRQQFFRPVHPVLAAGDQRDDIQEPVQALRRFLAPRGPRRHHHGLRLQSFQPIAQRVVLRAEEFDAGPQQQRQRRPGEQEEEQVGHYRHPSVLLIP